MAFAFLLLAMMAPIRGTAQSCASCAPKSCGNVKWEVWVTHTAVGGAGSVFNIVNSGVGYSALAGTQYADATEDFSKLGGQYWLEMGGWGTDDNGNSVTPDSIFWLKKTNADGSTQWWDFMTNGPPPPESGYAVFLLDLGGQEPPSDENSIPGAASDPQPWISPASSPSPDGAKPNSQSAPTPNGFTQTFGMGQNATGQAGYITVDVNLAEGTVTAGYVTFDLTNTTYDTSVPGKQVVIIPTINGPMTCTITRNSPNYLLEFTDELEQVVATHVYAFSGGAGNRALQADSVVGVQHEAWSAEATKSQFQVNGDDTGVTLGSMVWEIGDEKKEVTSEGVNETMAATPKVGRKVTEKRFKKLADGTWAIASEEIRREMGSYTSAGNLLTSNFLIESRSVRTGAANTEFTTTDYAYYGSSTETTTLGGVAKTNYLKAEVSSDGTWKKYEYAASGNKVFVGTPWLDGSGATGPDNASSANCRVSIDEHLASGIDQTEKILDVQTRKRETVYASTSSVSAPPLPAGAGTLSGLATLEKDAAGNTLMTTRRFNRKMFDDPADSSRKVTVGLDQSADGLFQVSEEVKVAAVGNVPAATTTKITAAVMDGETPKYLNQTVSVEGIVAGHRSVTETRQVWGTQTGAWAPAGSVTHLYDGDHISESTADGSVIYQREPDAVAGNGDKTVTETDAHGITRVSVFNAADELLSETKSGMVGATNPGVAASVTTTHTRVPALVAGVEPGSMVLAGMVETVMVKVGPDDERTESETDTDFQGRVVRTVDAIGRVTRYAYSDDGRTVTETLPGDVTRVTTRYLDGQLKSIVTKDGNTPSSQIVQAEFHNYQVNNDGTITETVSFGGTGTGETVNSRKITRNALAWTLREEEPAPLAGSPAKVTTHTYNSKGQRVSTQTTGLAALRFEYDEFGRLKRQGYDVDENEVLGTGTDPTTETVVEYLASGGVWHEVTKQRRFVSGGPPEETQHWRKLTEGPLTFEKVVSPDGSRTQTAVTVDRGNKRVTETRSFFRSSTGGVAAVSTRTYSNGLLVGETLADVSVPVAYVHNAFGQVTGMSHPQAGTMGWGYDPATGQRASEVSAAQGTVTYEYYPSDEAGAGEIKSVTRTTVDAVTTVVTRQAYNTLGQMTHQWGSAAQPIQYIYDELGRLKEMRTYKDGTGWNTEELPPDFSTASFASTKWDYHPGTDALSTKTDAANRAVEYVYDGAGLLTARKWARKLAGTTTPLTTSYSYQQTPNGLAVPGRVTGISYNDGVTPPVSMTYGRAYLSQVTDAAGQRFVSGTQYLGGGTENYVGDGWLKGLWVGRTVGHNGGSRTVLAKIGPQTIVQQTMAVLPEMGEAMVTDWLALGGNETHTYKRNAASGRLESLERNALSYARRWQYDPFGRLNRVDNGGMGVKYEHRADGKRSAMWQWKPTAAGTVSEVWPGWAFHYNDRGEVDGSSRFVPAFPGAGEEGSSVVENQTRAYAYDNMGNRLATNQGLVDPVNNPGHTTGYAPNALNQYDAITNVRHAEIRGQAVDGSKVTVRINGEQAVTIREEGQPSPPQNQTGDPNSFRYEAPVTTTDASWLDVEIMATKNGLSQNKRGFTYVPPASEAPLYDEDGNQTSDGRWLYFWDAENRMTGAEEKPRAVGGVNDPALPLRKKLTFAYDYRHRRIMKQVHEWEGDAATGGFTKLVKDLRFVYDDWNLIAELDHTTASANSLHGSTVVRSYVWGLDLAGQSGADFQSVSDPWQGAGGVGGLLSVKYQGVTYRLCYDGNGNIIGLQAGDGPQAGQIVARYDYDPFGNRITDTGPGVELCPFGFSTKYRDEETGIIHYELRDYQPPHGRWMSPDRIGERGGINLYGMVGNDPVSAIDALGLIGEGYDYAPGFKGNNITKGVPFGRGALCIYTGAAAGGPTSMYIHYMMGYTTAISGERRSGTTNDILDISPSGLIDNVMRIINKDAVSEISSDIVNDAIKTRIKTRVTSTKADTTFHGGRESFNLISPFSDPAARATLQRFTISWEYSCSIACSPEFSESKVKCGIKFELTDFYNFSGSTWGDKIQQYTIGLPGIEYWVIAKWNGEGEGVLKNGIKEIKRSGR